MTSPTERAVQPFAVHGDVDTGFGPVLDAFTSSFADDGAGGQLAFADDEYGVGFAYLSNQMGGLVDARATELTAAVKACLVGAK